MVNIIADYIPAFAPLPNIAPFTYKDGETYLSTLDNLRIYVNTTLVTFVNTNYSAIGDATATEINTLIDQVNGQITALTQELSGASVTFNDSIVKDIIDDVNSTTRQLTDTLYIPINKIGAASGIATLDSNSLVPDAELPARVSIAGLAAVYETGTDSVIYVSPNGNDSNTGKIKSSPMLTIDAARIAMGSSPGSIILDSGTISAGNGVKWTNTNKCGIIGQGEGNTIILATNQVGAVLDFSALAYAQDGIEIGGFTVSGDNTPGTGKKGIIFSPTLTLSRANIHDIYVKNTGDSCYDLGICELCDFSRLSAQEPVDAASANIPYIIATGAFNGNTLNGLQLYGVSTGANVGVGGAVVIQNDSIHTPHDNHIVTPKLENLHLLSGATVFNLKSNSIIISDLQQFDCTKINGSTGTSSIRLDIPTIQNYGGNLVRGMIPGTVGTSTSIDTGIDLIQSRNRIDGVKFYKGGNVTIQPNSGYNNIMLGGSVSEATNPGVIDNSGLQSNIVIDPISGISNYSGYKQFISGKYYGPSSHSIGISAMVVNLMYAVPFYLPVATRFKEICIEVTTANTGAIINLGIYSGFGIIHPVDLPYTKLSEYDGIDASTTGVKAVTIDQTLQAGQYFLSAVCQIAGISVRSITGSLPPVTSRAFGGIDPTQEDNCYAFSSTSGEMINAWGATDTTRPGAPKIMLQAY